MTQQTWSDKDNLVLAREELWDTPTRACALALIDIAQSLRDHRTKVLTDDNVPTPDIFGSPPDPDRITELDVADHDVPQM